MGGEDDGDAAFAQAPHHLPHVAAKLDVDAGGGFVQEQDLRLVAERLGDHHPPLHAAGERRDLGVLLVPQGQVAQHLFHVGVVGRLPEQAAAVIDGRPDGFEGVGRQLLGHQADLGPRRPVVLDHVVAIRQHTAIGGAHQAAGYADQGRLARAVGAEQGEDLPLPDDQVDALERLETASVGLRKAFYRNDWLHASPPGARR